MNDEITVEHPAPIAETVADASAAVPAPTAAEDSVEIAALLDTIAKSQNDGALDILAASADSLVEQNKALSAQAEDLVSRFEKSFAELSARMDALTAKVEAAAVAAQAEADATPIVKSVSHIPSPLDPAPAAAEPLSKSIVVTAAIKELASCEDPTRKLQLRSAIAKLESNYSPSQVAAELHINI